MKRINFIVLSFCFLFFSYFSINNYSEPSGPNLWYINNIRNHTYSNISASSQNIIYINNNSLEDILFIELFDNLILNVSAYFGHRDLYADYLSNASFSPMNNYIQNQITACLSLRTFYDYYISFSTSYAQNSIENTFQNRLFFTYYGFGLEKLLTKNTLMSISYNTYHYSSHSIIWNSKHIQSKQLDLMIKMTF